MTTRRALTAAVLGALLLGPAACRSGPGASSGTDSASAADSAAASSSGAEGVAPRRTDVTPAARVQLDSGNASYRAQDYQEAGRHYRAALEAEPGLTSAWFGIYMAESALGNRAAADSARAHLGQMGGGAAAHVSPHAGMTTPDTAPTPPSGDAVKRDSTTL